MSDNDYNFSYLDEQTKRMIRRALLKALAIPGYQVPFASRIAPSASRLSFLISSSSDWKST